AFERGAITFLRLGKFSALEINIAKLEMMIGVVQMMNLRLKLLDAGAAPRAGQVKTGGSRMAINGKIIPDRAQPGADENKQRPNPFAVAAREWIWALFIFVGSG